MQILIVNDGSDNARMAALYGALIARPAKADVTLLGITKGPKHEKSLRLALETLGEEIGKGGTSQVRLKLRSGSVDAQILAETAEHFYHLVVVGSQGRRYLQRFLFGSTAKRLARHINMPILIVTKPRSQISRMLICTGGDTPGERDTLIGGALAALLGAHVCVLHVMSQLPLTPEADIHDLESDVPELIKRESREGRHLRRALEILETQGVPSHLQEAKVRHGLVLDEILNEIYEGDYDLIVIGAHHVPEDKPWNELRQLLQEDMSDHILTHTKRPVLVVRTRDEREWITTTK